MDVKRSVMKARSMKKNVPKFKGIYINEDLTERRRMILKALRGFKKEKLVTDCWSFNGRICFKSLAGIIHDVTDTKSVDMTMIHSG